jgi:hypothetical protein
VDCNSPIVWQTQNSVLRCWHNVFFLMLLCPLSHILLYITFYNTMFVSRTSLAGYDISFLVFVYAFSITIILSTLST